MTAWRRSVILRASAWEFLLSAIVAPVMMVRQSTSVFSILLGRDCGWKSRTKSRPLPRGSVEAMWGMGFAAMAVAAGPVAGLWLAPIVLPLLAAPLPHPLSRGLIPMRRRSFLLSTAALALAPALPARARRRASPP